MSFSKNNSENIGSVRCSICHCKIGETSNIYQSSFNLSVICEKCWKKFTKEDIELISNLFISYGGYFGKYEDSMVSIEDIVKKMIKKIESGSKKIELNELNVRILHEALLHGFTSKNYIRELQNYLRE